MKKILPVLALSAILGLSTTPNKPKEVKAATETIKYGFVENCDLVHARFPGNPDDLSEYGHELEAFGTNWEQSSIPDITNNEATYARLVVNVSHAGEYSMKIYYRSSDYKLRIFTNSFSNYNTINLPSADWQDSSTTIKLNLVEGKNVVLFQVNNWGQLQSFEFDETVEVLNHHSLVSGVYYASDITWQAAYLNSSVNVFDPDAEMKYTNLSVNDNPSFEGAAILHFTPASTTTALDLKLVSSGATTMRLTIGSNPDNSKLLVLPEFNLTTSYTYHLSNETLSSLGFTGGEKQILRFATAEGNLQLNWIKESTVSEEVDPIIDEPTEKVYTGTELVNAVKINGRSLMDGDSICLDWSNSGVEFMVSGTGDLVGDFTLQSNSQNTRFAVEIDGFPRYYITPNGKTNIATGISGTHKIGLFKTSEAAGNLCKLNALCVDKDTVVSKPTDTREYKFEIIGDSITCANQIEENVEDAYWGYARLLAKSWNADLSTISCSGRGLAQGFNSEEGWPASTQHQMKDIYDQTSYFRNPNINWDANNYTPDVVVINLGSNDLGNYILTCQGCSLENFLTSVTSFSNKVSSRYPNAKIVWAYGSFVNRKYIEEYRNTVEALHNNNIGFVELPQMMHGDSGHPNDLNHDTIAKLISAKIAQMLNVADRYVPRFDYQTLEAEDGTLKGGEVHVIDRDKDADIYWSGRGYLGGMGFDDKNPSYPTSIDLIKDDLSNISYVKVRFNAPKDANYIIRIGYATIGSAKIGYRANNGQWKETICSGNDWCGGHGLFNAVELAMSKGENEIYFTSALNAGGWINYDFFDVITGEIVTMHTVSASGEHVQFSGVPSKVENGGSFSFTVTLDANYSKSTIEVKVNGEVVTATEGVYRVNNVTSNVSIVATGATLNTWTVHYVTEEGGSDFATKEVVVGAVIPTNVGTPTKDGYVFNGWDIQFSQMPNSDIIVIAKWIKKSAPEKKGCGGSIATTSAIVSSLAVAGLVTVALRIKKKKEDK